MKDYMNGHPVSEVVSGKGYKVQFYRVEPIPTGECAEIYSVASLLGSLEPSYFLARTT